MLSTSATPNPAKFYWMRYTLDRAVNVTVAGQPFKIVKGTIFGVREIRGSQVDELMLKSGQTFRLDIKKSEVLMNRSKEFKGQIKLDAVVKKPAILPAVKTKTSKPVVKPSAKPVSQVKHMQSPVRVKLSDVDLPEMDEFADDEIPYEFSKHRVHSSENPNWLTVIATTNELRDTVPGTFREFNAIVQSTIEPHIRKARHEINAAVNEAAMKVKAWAMIHLQQAQKLGRSTELFEKLVNNPTAAVKQLAHSMLGIKTPEVPVKEESIDSLLDGLKF
jgi:hypothetical protein